ncbi:MAG TPA: TadE family protein [Candidatus Binataceae bacterium]|nr:TadE family protein [Candidatus Binataceae bacterium]
MDTKSPRTKRRRLVDYVTAARRMTGAGRAQAAVEMAIILPIALVVLVVGIQYAIIGEAALALGQANFQGARYAAVNTSANQSTVQSYMVSVASPLISASNGQYLTSTLNPTPPCAFGSTVTVSLTYNASHLVALPNPFLGISFPKTLSSSESAFCE